MHPLGAVIADEKNYKRKGTCTRAAECRTCRTVRQLNLTRVIPSNYMYLPPASPAIGVVGRDPSREEASDKRIHDVTPSARYHNPSEMELDVCMYGGQ